MTTFTLIALIVFLAAVLITDIVRQRTARRDRLIVRRIHTYLAALPPAKPW